MKHKKFSVMELAGISFRLTFKNFGLFTLVALAFIGFFIISNLLMGLAKVVASFFAPSMGQMMQSGADPLSMMKMGADAFLKMGFAAFIVFSIVVLITSLFWLGFNLGYVQILFDLYDKGKSKVARLFSCFGLLGKYLFAILLIFIIFLGALIVSGLFGVFVGLFFKPHAVFLGVVLFSFIALFLRIRLKMTRFFIIDKKFDGKDAVKASFYATRGHFWKLFGATILSSLMKSTIVGIPAATIMMVAIYRKIA